MILPTAVLALLRRLGPITRAQVLLRSGTVAALALLLRYIFDARLRQLDDQSDEYDVIVVGGGTSGCALASRLSEDPTIRVLLLEAGGSGRALAASRVPARYGALLHSKYVHDIRTEPQAHANGRRSFWPRAKMLGGCSSINAQMAQYGSPEDYDQWAELTGDDSWSWKNFSRYFTKFEKYQPDPAYPGVDASVRGSSGPVRVGYFNTVTSASKAFIKAAVNVGIPFTADFNGTGGTIGVSRIMTYVDENWERVSSESAYLTKDVLARKNLKVTTHAQVTRVIFAVSHGETRAVGVEFANTRDGPRYRARARKEIIISGGAVHSPQILMLSGIGPAAHLRQHGIPIIHDLPGVGARLVDHPIMDLHFKDKLGVSAKYFKPTGFAEAGKLVAAFAQYYVMGKGGPLAMNFGESAAFVRSDDPVLYPESEYPEKLPDSTSGPGSPDLEFFTTPLAYKDHGAVFYDVHTYALHVYLLRPTSSGSVLLKSSDPWEQPSVNPNYLQTPEDAAKLLRGVRTLLKIAQTEPLAPLLDQDFKRSDLDHELHLKSDAELKEAIKERVETVYHPTTTCRMAPAAEDGVVDSQLRVYGVRGLRVCDASIFPWIISGHTTGACYAVAEKLADMIRAEIRSP